MVNKHIKRGLFAILAVLGLAIIAMPSANAVPGRDVADLNKIEKSLVYLKSEAYGTVTYKDIATGEIQISAPFEAEMGYCTGFIVSRAGHIVSAGHCPDEDGARMVLMQKYLADHTPVDPDLPPGFPPFMSGVEPTVEVLEAHGEIPGSEPIVRVTVTQMQNALDAPLRGLEPVVAQVLDYRPLREGDMALMKIDVNMPLTPLPIAPRSPANGAEVTAIGYPGIVSESMGKLGESPNQRMSMYHGFVSQHQPPDLIGWPALELSTMMHGGMSGGPVVNTKGEVIGNVSFGLAEQGISSGINFSTDTPELRGFLTRNGVDFEENAQVITRQYPTTSGSTDKPIVTHSIQTSVTTVDWDKVRHIGVIIGAMVAIGGAALLGLAVGDRRRTRQRPLPPAHDGQFHSPYPPHQH